MSTAIFPGEQSVDHAPMPTARTLRWRSNLGVQAWRFAMINLRMLRMIRRSHHHPTR
jgi:hypothetical protein